MRCCPALRSVPALGVQTRLRYLGCISYSRFISAFYVAAKSYAGPEFMSRLQVFSPGSSYHLIYNQRIACASPTGQVERQALLVQGRVGIITQRVQATHTTNARWRRGVTAESGRHAVGCHARRFAFTTAEESENGNYIYIDRQFRPEHSDSYRLNPNRPARAFLAARRYRPSRVKSG